MTGRRIEHFQQKLGVLCVQVERRLGLHLSVDAIMARLRDDPRVVGDPGALAAIQDNVPPSWLAPLAEIFRFPNSYWADFPAVDAFIRAVDQHWQSSSSPATSGPDAQDPLKSAVEREIAQHFSRRHAIQIELDTDEQQRLNAAMPRSGSELDAVANADEACRRFLASLTTMNRNHVFEFQRNPDVHILLVHHLPLDTPLPETPIATGYAGVASISLTAMLMVAFARAIGQAPLSYIWENEGRLFRHVTGTLASGNRPTSQGAVKLGWHTEHPQCPLAGVEAEKRYTVSPETILLCCLRSKRDVTRPVPTQFAPAAAIYAGLSSGAQTMLQEPLFTFPVSESTARSMPARTDAPVFYLDNGQILIRFRDGVHSSDPTAQAALDELRAVLTAHRWVEINLEANTLVLFKNNHYLHSRDEFLMSKNGVDRWLLRLFACRQELIRNVHPEAPFLGI